MAQASRVQTQPDAQPDLVAPPVRRHAWINIAGPLSALFMGGFAAMMYLKPIDTLRWIQLTRLGWSGVTQNEIALNDGLMTYLITGGYWDQEPVLMIHGLGPNAALEWRGVISPVSSAHYKVVAPNLLGFASSDHKQVEHTIAYEAGAMGQLIDQLKLDKINLVASDIGADVALYYAVDHPEKIERLILVSGGLFGANGAARLRGMIPSTPEATRATVEASFFNLPPMPEFMYERMQAALAGDLQAQTEMINSIPHDEGHIRSKLGQIFNTLTIVIYGWKNPYFSKAQGESLHDALPGSAPVSFKTSGAFPQLEHPDDFSDSLVYILKLEEGGQ